MFIKSSHSKQVAMGLLENQSVNQPYILLTPMDKSRWMLEDALLFNCIVKNWQVADLHCRYPLVNNCNGGRHQKAFLVSY